MGFFYFIEVPNGTVVDTFDNLACRWYRFVFVRHYSREWLFLRYPEHYKRAFDEQKRLSDKGLWTSQPFDFPTE